MSEQLTKNSISCVFVHGWAMNSAVWQQCVSALPAWIDPIRIDLPGHGTMAKVSATGLDDYVREIALVVQRPTVWIGWSLGGLAVLQLAQRFPERVAGLFMVACNPRFVQTADWPGVQIDVFDQFAELLQSDVSTGVRRFLSLQVRGSENAKQTVRELQQALQQRGTPDLNSLKRGLDILATSDLREQLTTLHKPINWYLGGRDTLVPVAVAAELKRLQPNIDIMIEPEAGHAPFISHPQAFVDALVAFAYRVQSGDR